MTEKRQREIKRLRAELTYWARAIEPVEAQLNWLRAKCKEVAAEYDKVVAEENEELSK